MKARTTGTALAAAAALTAAALAGCTTSNAGAQPVPISSCTNCAPVPTAPPTSLTTAKPTEQEDRAAAEQVWAKYSMLAFSISSLAKDRVEASIAEVAVDPAAQQLRNQYASDQANHRAGYGSVVTWPKWTNPVKGGDIAVFTDCQDQSTAGVQDTKTGNKLTVGVAQTPLRATVTRTPSGWRVKKAELLEGQTCTAGN